MRHCQIDRERLGIPATGAPPESACLHHHLAREQKNARENRGTVSCTYTRGGDVVHSFVRTTLDKMEGMERSAPLLNDVTRQLAIVPPAASQDADTPPRQACVSRSSGRWRVVGGGYTKKPMTQPGRRVSSVFRPATNHRSPATKKMLCCTPSRESGQWGDVHTDDHTSRSLQ